MNGLPPLAVGDRARRVRDSLETAGCEAVLVTELANVRWLTGFTGSAGRLLVLPDDLVLVTDGRYGDQAAGELARAGVEARVLVGRTQPAQRELLRDGAGGVRRLGLEAGHVSWADQRGFAELWPATELVPTTGFVEQHRVVKDAGELARIEAAADITDAALAAVLPLLVEGPTEAEVALALEVEMRRRGAAGASFETIVASGPNSGLPHHRAGARRIVEGDLVVIDVGALVDGYHSDMTRTYVVGEPTPDQAELLAVVTAAQAAGVAAVRAGVEARAVDAACRDLLTEAGHGERFTHGTGHGVGLHIHELPWLNSTSTDVLAAGAVLTVEPGVYRGDLGGVRVEDAVVVTSTGCRPLTKTPKDPTCLPSRPTT